jgi:cobalamin biosynthesis protein CobT
MADAELRIEELELERSGVSESIKHQRELRRKLAGVIDSGTEKRDVRCAWIEDFAQNCFHLVRQDTGEVIDTRAMTAGDRQEALFDGEPKQPAGEETVDLDDEEPADEDDQDEDNQDDELGGEDEEALEDEGDDEGGDVPGTEVPGTESVKTRTRGRQPQPAA